MDETTPTAPPSDTEPERVQSWRTSTLRRAGYSELGASLLAGRLEVDLHGAVALAAHGCDEQVALRILL